MQYHVRTLDPQIDANPGHLTPSIWMDIFVKSQADSQPSGMASALLPEGITKDMKTEDDILAQMRANQDPATQNLTFMSEQPLSLNPEDAFTAGTNIAPNLEELQKLIESDVHGSSAHRSEGTTAMADPTARTISLPQPNANAAPNLAEQKKQETLPKVVDTIPEVSAKQSIKSVEPKSPKQPPKEAEKPAKPKEVAVVKPKKKTKDEKDAVEVKAKDDDVNTTVKRTAESSPPKNKKEEKPNKKEMEKEKKEWLKDGFTIVKSTEKKDNKKKEKEEARAAEEAEKKRKEEEKRAQMEAEKNRQPEPVTRRQQMEIGQAQRSQQLQQQQQQLQQQQLEQAPKKAPWSAPAAAGRDHLALADIQRLEREKKLEQKEHQLILQAIAAQHQTAALREQEAQAQIGWATKKQQNNSPPGQTLAQIQAEARKQAAAIAAAATAAACEEALVTPPPVQAAPWGAINGVGFWDTSVGSVPSPAPAMQPSLSCNRLSEPTRLPEPKPKKKVAVVTQAKKETTPSADFDIWCTNVLSNWRDVNIDVPTFVAFLRDIESPYEVKDYVKCYLGDTKESTDFSRQFLERRSRLLRVGMVAPTDDLGAPAAALTPRTNSGSDYTEVKGKSKKTKKNKMFKVDARILGFSVTASEDRINIGDIDTV